MDELTAVLKARSLVNKVAPPSCPVDLQLYADEANAKIKIAKDLGHDEDGFSMMRPNGGFGICVNGNQNAERQRFTICHELAHIVLELPSQHGGDPAWSYSKRAPDEVICDVFAAELLLPYKLFKPLVDAADVSLAEISALARQFEASLLATGSRFAALSRLPCAFVLSQGDKICYASRSTPLRDARGWIPLGVELPDGSMARACRNGRHDAGPEEVDCDIWFPDWENDGTLVEQALHVPSYDQTYSLLWFEDEDNFMPRADNREIREEELNGLVELDGNLPWPGKSKRRR
ncbi:MAG: ImmA/IrrE family metallo-endopeptidase [Sphingomicrobium sp.]